MGESERRGMTPKDILRIVWLSDPQISPDGRRVAFVATTLSEDKDEYLSQIWMVGRDGRGAAAFHRGTPARHRASLVP